MLTRIAYASKRYWGYPEEYIELWHEDLTVTPAKVEQDPTYVAMIQDDGILLLRSGGVTSTLQSWQLSGLPVSVRIAGWRLAAREDEPVVTGTRAEGMCQGRATTCSSAGP